MTPTDRRQALRGAAMRRSRWAAVGAATAIVLGAGGVGFVDAGRDSGHRSVYSAIEPCRLLDTRPGERIGRSAPLGPGETLRLKGHGDQGQCTGLPADAVALELNVTALRNTVATHLTVWSGAGEPPNASHLNLAIGAPPTPNSVTTELDGPNFSIRNAFGHSHVIVDVVGVYQDHTHDDRYYTETESDDRYSTKSDSSSRYDDGQGDIDTTPVDQPQALSPTDRVLATVTVDTPTRGYLTLTASGYAWNNTTADRIVRCSITTGTTLAIGTEPVGVVQIAAGFRQVLTTTRAVQVDKAPGSPDELTYHFVCDSAHGSFDAYDIQFSAIFIPDPDALADTVPPVPLRVQSGPGPQHGE